MTDSVNKGKSGSKIVKLQDLYCVEELVKLSRKIAAQSRLAAVATEDAKNAVIKQQLAEVASRELTARVEELEEQRQVTAD